MHWFLAVIYNPGALMSQSASTKQTTRQQKKAVQNDQYLAAINV